MMHHTTPSPATDRSERIENLRLVTGQGRFTSNKQLPGMVFAAFVRSDYPHARLKHIDLSHARHAPGVLSVLTSQDLSDPVMPEINPSWPAHSNTAFSVLARDTVHYVGQPIVLVVAHSLEQAQFACTLIQIEYQPDGESDATPNPFDTPTFTNHYAWPNHPRDSTDSAPASTPTVDTHLRWPRVVAMAMEPRACVARWADHQLTLWVGTQTPSRTQQNLAHALGLPVDHVRVISDDVGGAFGAKSSIYPEEIAVALAARSLAVPIKWQASRSEEFTSAYHGRGAALHGTLRVSDTGQIQHLSAQVETELGAWLPYSAAVPLRNATRILPGPYRVPSGTVQGHAYRSHTSPVNIFRGAGRPEAALLMETLIDKAARAIGFDPVEFRRFNLIGASDMPYQTPTGETIDSGDLAATLSLASEKFDYFAQRTAQQRRRLDGEIVGIGVGLYIEPCGQGWESATVTLHDAHSATIASGTPAQGQGHATTFLNLAAHALHYDPKHIEVLLGDTQTCPQGVGALASRSMAIGASALLQACQQARAQRDQGHPYPITVSTRFESAETWSNGCVMVQLTIDRQTGVIALEKIVWADDAGVILNPELAYDQLLGGAAQGIGQALMEQLHYDDYGQLTTGSLMDYAIPRATDMPSIEIYSLHTASTTNPIGAKGVGEAGCIGVPAAILNAVRDALHGHLGHEAPDLSLPLTAPNVWQVLTSQGQGHSVQTDHNL